MNSLGITLQIFDILHTFLLHRMKILQNFQFCPPLQEKSKRKERFSMSLLQEVAVTRTKSNIIVLSFQY